MTIAKDFAAKLAVAFVAAAMIFSAFAPAAKAQTTEELQQMINDLLAQVAALQSSTGQGATGVASGVCPYTWTRDLSSGSTGGDVMKLQQFLNADPDTRVAAAGAGSVGAETEYYGPATAAAVSKLQVKYRSEVLSPANLVNPTGYFGPGTRAKANSLCVAAPVVTDDSSDDSDDSMDDSDDSSTELSGEASLDNAEMDDASDDTIEEGDEDAEVAEFTVEFTDGDAEISRIDVSFDGVASTDPWDVLETVSLWVDGDKVAEMNADDEDDYQNDDMTLRFTGLDIIGMEDEEFDIVIAVSVQNNIDSNDLDSFDVTVESIRYFDADGVASTEVPGSGETGVMDSGSARFKIEEAGTDDELIVKTSSNDPDSTTLQLEDDKKSDWYTLFVFDLDTDDSVNDIEINELPITVEVSSSTFNAIVDDVEIVIDGTTIDDYDLMNGTTSTAVLTFDVDGDVVIDAGDRVEVEVMVRFKSLALGNEGITASSSVTSANRAAIDAEGADDLSGSQLQGAAAGEDHTLRTSGIDVSVVSVDADVETPDGNTNDYGTYTIEVEVTAFEQDVYISTNPAAGVTYTLEDGVGSSSIAGTRSAVLTSSADEVGSYFEITEGETETLTLTVTYTPGVAGTQSRLVLSAINFAPTAVSATQNQSTLPASDYRTAVKTMVN